jgi:hypothetical protein
LLYLCWDNNPIVYPPPEELYNELSDLRTWMKENPLSFTKSANKV